MCGENAQAESNAIALGFTPISGFTGDSKLCFWWARNWQRYLQNIGKHSSLLEIWVTRRPSPKPSSARPTSGEEPLAPKRWSGIRDMKREMPMPRHPPTSLDSTLETAPHNQQDER